MVAGTASGVIAGTIPWSYLLLPSLMLTVILVGGVVADRLLRRPRLWTRLDRLAGRRRPGSAPSGPSCWAASRMARIASGACGCWGLRGGVGGLGLHRRWHR